MISNQQLPLLVALLISVGIHLAFFVQWPKAPPLMNVSSGPAAPSIALKLTPPAKKPAAPMEEKVLTTQALETKTHIVPKKELDPEVLPEKKPPTEQIKVTRKAQFRSQPIAPVYPEKSRRNHEEGIVMVRAQVDAAGQTQAVQIAQSSGFPLLDKAALDAVSQWEFIAAKQNDQTITAWIEVPIDFKLR
jgi:periplasmic protein TonB